MSCMSSISVEKFQNDMTFIYADIGLFICAYLSVLLSVMLQLSHKSNEATYHLLTGFS